MFVFQKNPRFTNTVAIQRPVDGGFDHGSMRATFEVIGDGELATFDVNQISSSQEFLKRVLVGFDDVVDDANAPVPFNDATRDALIDVPFVRLALVKAYFAGLYKGALGN